MGKPILVDLDFTGGAKITGLPAAAAAGQPVTYEQMNAAVEGTNWKDDVRVATTANVTLSGPGAAIDGVTLTSGDRVLVKDQTTASQNGIYIFNGAAVPLTRAVDGSTFTELEAAIVIAKAGTANGGAGFRQTQVGGVIDTNDVLWTSYGANTPDASESTAGKAELATTGEANTGTDDARIMTPKKVFEATYLIHKPFVQTIGDASATSFNIDHSLGTRDVTVEVYKNSGNYDTVIADVTRTSTSRVVVSFASAPASNAYRVVVVG